MTAYYNEHDTKAAAWLRELIKAGAIAPGEVDERSIEDVLPSDLRGFVQCHFFAGIGVWSYALRQAGWPDDRPVWTGSCPCQPFSAAGKGAGFDDERHLWPAFHWLIDQRRPPVILGEQVATKAVDTWVDLVHADLEALDYAFGCIPFPSAGIGATDGRERTYWVAHADRYGFDRAHTSLRNKQDDLFSPAGGSEAVQSTRRVAYEHSSKHFGVGRLVDPATYHTFWSEPDWIRGRDGLCRPVEPGTFPLAHGAPARVGRLRGYGNAVNAEAAKVWIETCMSVSNEIA